MQTDDTDTDAIVAPTEISRRKREGFPGQLHIVLPGPVTDVAQDDPLLKGLYVTDVGVYPHAQGHRVTRSKGAHGAILIVCTAGGGWVLARGQRQEVKAGNVVFLAPHEPHAYGANLEDPWTIEWIHFSGTEISAWRELIVGAEFHMMVPSIAIKGIGLVKIYEALQSGYDEVRILFASTLLRNSLMEILQLKRLRRDVPTSVEAVEAAAAWMRDHLASRVTLDELSRMANMSPSRFSDIFRQRSGYSPLDWFMRQRIQHACRLLDTTREKVETIGREVGFEDPYYFSRSFRKVMGCSPRAYRAIQKG